MTPADCREPDAGGEDSTDPDRGWESELRTMVAVPKAGAEAADTGPDQRSQQPKTETQKERGKT